ncbi:MAG: hypothetical protein D6751_11460 [Deltaproteobacteria bacterium]|nr:MAG: hypothetical protein D6751_11460 [Deltaproteobacteria bacterium]
MAKKREEPNGQMMNLLPALGRLEDIDGVCMRLHLEFEESFDLDWTHLLRLRREAYQVGRQLLESSDGMMREGLSELLFPAAPADPRMRRLAPVTPVPFILQLDSAQSVKLEPGDVLPLDFLLVGRGRHFAQAFACLFRDLGRRGLFNGQGHFTLDRVDAVGIDGAAIPIWHTGAAWREPEWPLHQLWPEEISMRPCTLTFITPARILARGKPLFRPGLKHLVPVMVRRVSSLVHAWCGVDLLADPQALLAELPATDIRGTLRWQDWRRLEGDHTSQDLGGVVGSVDIPREWLEVAGPFIHLCRQFNFGKGAAFGAGSFILNR